MGHLRLGLLLVILGLLTSGCANTSRLSPPVRDFGPFYSQHKDVDGNLRTRAVGPVYEHVTSPAGDALTAVRPFWSRTVDAKKEKTRHEVMWPLASSKQWLGEHRWWAGPVWAWNYDVSDPRSQKRLWVVPFWASGISREGNDYWGLFPVWGKINDFATMDEISWQLWPLHVTTRKNETNSDAWLWPIYSKTTSTDPDEPIDRFRVFPFYGHSSFKDQYTKRFIAWPFWTEADYRYAEDPGKAWMLWPFYGQLQSKTQNTRWVFPPFFRMETDNDGRKIHLPWPLYQFQDSDTVQKRYLFPIWGTKTVGGTKTDFLFWPIFSHQQIRRGEQLIDRKIALPILQHETRTEGDGTVSTRKEKVWPLGSYRREGDVIRLRAFDLWPLVDTPAIERNYAPLWTVYRQDQRLAGPVGGPAGRSDTEALWGVYRYVNHGEDEHHQSFFPFWERWGDEKDRGWQVGKGLFGMGRDENGRTMRLFWVFGR